MHASYYFVQISTFFSCNLYALHEELVLYLGVAVHALHEKVELNLDIAVHVLYEELELRHKVKKKKTLCTEKSASVRYAEKNALVAVTAFICPQKDAEVELLHYKDQDFMSSLAGKREGCYAPPGVNVEERTAAVFYVPAVTARRARRKREAKRHLCL